MTARQDLDQPDIEARCRECDTVFTVRAIAKCPCCGSRYLEPVKVVEPVR